MLNVTMFDYVESIFLLKIQKIRLSDKSAVPNLCLPAYPQAE